MYWISNTSTKKRLDKEKIDKNFIGHTEFFKILKIKVILT